MARKLPPRLAYLWSKENLIKQILIAIQGVLVLILGIVALIGVPNG